MQARVPAPSPRNDLVEAEQKKNQELMQKIQELEAKCQVQEKQNCSQARLEQLLEQTLARVSNLEGQVETQNRTLEPETKSVQHPGNATPPAVAGDGAASNGEEEDDDDWVTTPGGHRVPGLMFYICLQC